MSPEQNDGQGTALDLNDTARQPDGAPPASAPAVAGASDPPAAPSDPDAAEMAAALAALAAEEAAKAGGDGQQPAAQPPAAAASHDAQQDSIPAAAAPPKDQPTKPVPMVPHQVFHRERTGRQAAERERDFLAGKVEALEAMGRGTAVPASTTAAPAAAAPAPAADPVQAEIDAKQAEINALAEKADMGEISFSEFEKARAPLSQRIAHLHTQQVIAASMPQQGPSLADTAIITAHLTTLAQEFPHSQLLTPDQAQWLAAREIDKARAFGRPYGTDRKADLDLQAAVAAQAEGFFLEARIAVPPEITAAAEAAKQRRSGGAQQPKPGQQPALSPDAQARLRKMDMAAGLPPDTAQMGAAGSSSLDLSEASLAAMDDEQIAALPAATRARFFKLTG